jgi:diguanylate cyclase (GGDEF)-like protein
VADGLKRLPPPAETPAVKRLFAMGATSARTSLLLLRLLRLPRGLALGLIGLAGAGVSALATCAVLLLRGHAGLGAEALLLAALVPTLVAMPLCFVMLGAMTRLDTARACAPALIPVLNRADFLTAAAPYLNAAAAPTSICLIAIDDFPRVIDSHGQGAGAALRHAVIVACKTALRPADLLAHWQDDQLSALLVGVDAHGAVAVAQRLHTMIQAVRLAHPNHGLRVTASIGVASAGPHPLTLQLLVAQVESALSAARQNGRGGIRLVLPDTASGSAQPAAHAKPGKQPA